MKKVFFISCLMVFQLSADITIHNHTNMTVNVYKIDEDKPFKNILPSSICTIKEVDAIALQKKSQWITPALVLNGEKRHLYYEQQYPGSHVWRFVLTEKEKK